MNREIKFRGKRKDNGEYIKKVIWMRGAVSDELA